MNEMKLKDLFKQKKIRACEEGLEWLGDRTLAEMWAECERGDWMLWTYRQLYPNNIRELTAYAAAAGADYAYAAYIYGADSVRETNQKQTADVCRKYLTVGEE